MINRIKSMIVGAGLLPVLALGLVAGVPAVANAASCDDNVSVTGGAKCARSTDQKADIGVVIRDITNVLLFIIGAVAVIMIILGGIRYTISNGDSSQITSAKNTILYGVIGLIVALLAYAIVNFVIGAFTTTDAPAGGDGNNAAQ